MRRLVEHVDRDLRPAHPLGRVEHAEPEAGQKQPAHRGVDRLLGDQSLSHGGYEVRVDSAALEISSRFRTQSRRGGSRRCDLMALVDVVDGAAVRHDVAREAPLASQDVLEQDIAPARGAPVHAVVGAHQRVGVAFPDAGGEVRQIALAQIALADDGVEGVARGLGPRVHGEMLHGRDRLQVFRVIALHPTDELHGEPAGEERVLPVCLLAAAPARIAEQIDVRRPEGESLIALA